LFAEYLFGVAMNFKSEKDMKTIPQKKQESYYGIEPATLEQRMEWIEFLHHEIQLYKLLVEAAERQSTYNPASLTLEIERRKTKLLYHLPELAVDRWKP